MSNTLLPVIASAGTDAGAALAPLLSGGSRVRHWQSARIIWPDTRRQQLPLDNCCRLVLPYNAIHSIQQTEQIPNDPPQMGAKSTTTSNQPSTPIKAKTLKDTMLQNAALYIRNENRHDSKKDKDYSKEKILLNKKMNLV